MTSGDEPAGVEGRQAAPDAEPRYLNALSRERSVLTWQQCAFGLLAAAVASEFLGPQPSGPAAHGAAIGLTLLAIIALGIGMYRWWRTGRGVRRRSPSVPPYCRPAPPDGRAGATRGPVHTAGDASDTARPHHEVCK